MDFQFNFRRLTEIQPVEYRADLVVLLMSESGPVFGIIVEVQLSSDPRKRYVWPAYAANLRAQLECPAQVLVVTDDNTVATWAAQSIDIGCGNILTPLVIGPSDVPDVVDEEQAQAHPELAVLSAIAHDQDQDVTRSARIAAAANALVPVSTMIVQNFTLTLSIYLLAKMPGGSYKKCCQRTTNIKITLLENSMTREAVRG